ncbi:hypothetical protein QAD02_022214 [Eretmocerus hayati]|uniref:Uncharacterized protein n=1 Tax=Eretmocerus hayati TaxID=131215 RepID=A0ACC2PSN5_9HYME|nr:hypothetical protein QAD02_022214 [Eretmocerus hayati]
MWRRTREVISSCYVFLKKCRRIRSNFEDDFAGILRNLEDDVDDPPVRLGPQLPFYAEVAAVRDQSTLMHRPDTPQARRRSPPELVDKVRLALQEMCGPDLVQPLTSPLQNPADQRQQLCIEPSAGTSVDENPTMTRSNTEVEDQSRQLLCIHPPVSGFGDEERDDLSDDWFST